MFKNFKLFERSPRVGGSIPDKEFLCNAMLLAELSNPKLDGMDPVKRLALTAKKKTFKDPIEDGNVPEKEFELRLKVIKLLIEPISDGIDPKKLLLCN